MFNNHYLSTMLIVLVHILTKSTLTKCDLDIDTDVVNKNIHDSNNLIRGSGNNVVKRLISESEFNAEIIRNIGRNSDAVNNYEDITVLDDDGELKTLKYKSVPAKVPIGLQNVPYKSDEVLTGDKLNSLTPVEDESNSNVALKSKFFDELGCKYIFYIHIHSNHNFTCYKVAMRF